jgi:plastocyanin
MPKRALIALAALGLIATGCVTSSTPPVDYGQGQRFVPFVVDSTDDVGQGSAVALTADGSPYVSYLGFPAKLAEGVIAVPRPFGAPAVPGVLLATADTTGLWQRGAVNTIEPTLTASGVSVPFGPVLTPNLDLTPENSNGTAVALADDGTVHVAWVMGGAVYVADTKLGGTSTVEKIFDLGSKVAQAGPIGKAGITLDPGGAPWVAFTVESSSGRQVHVVHADGSKWVDEVAATAPGCNSCGAPQPTGIGVVDGAPVVVFANASAGDIESATLQGGAWSVATVATSSSGATDGSFGRGLAFATDGKGAFASYYGGDGSVQVASLANGAWITKKVADTTDPTTPTSGNLAAATAVAVDKAGTVYVAWIDTELHLSSGTDSFTPVDIGHTTANAAGPSLASSDAGVALGWYDTNQQNQMIGFLGDLQNLLVAQPSPSLTISIAPPATDTCGKDKKVVLDIVAKGLAFTPTCLVAAPGSFTITMDNQDAGIPHNIDVFDQKGGKSLGASNLTAGPTTETLDLKLTAGTYYFQCDAHPTSMFGTLAVVAGAK